MAAIVDCNMWNLSHNWVIFRRRANQNSEIDFDISSSSTYTRLFVQVEIPRIKRSKAIIKCLQVFGDTAIYLYHFLVSRTYVVRAFQFPSSKWIENVVFSVFLEVKSILSALDCDLR